VLNRQQVSAVVSRAVSPEGKTVLVPVLEGLIAGALWQNGRWFYSAANRGGRHGGMRQAARRWTSQSVAAMSSADSASSQPASIHWKGQNRPAGW
jgi:hypothetical protein